MAPDVQHNYTPFGCLITFIIVYINYCAGTRIIRKKSAPTRKISAGPKTAIQGMCDENFKKLATQEFFLLEYQWETRVLYSALHTI